MAHRPSRPARRVRPAEKAASPRAGNPTGSEREKIIAAFLTLLAETSLERISLADIASGAGVTLAQMRGEFSSPLAILAAHLKDIDRAVLGEDFSDMDEEPPRERLFDVLMRRLEKLAPHRQAVRSLLRSASRNAPLSAIPVWCGRAGPRVRPRRWRTPPGFAPSPWRDTAPRRPA